jgi:hypothetical protein
MFNVQQAITSWLVSSVIDIADVKPSDVEGALLLGNAHLRNVNLKLHRINDALPAAVLERIVCTGAMVEDLRISVPWLSLSAKPIDVEATGVSVTIEANTRPERRSSVNDVSREDRERDLTSAIESWVGNSRGDVTDSICSTSDETLDFESCKSHDDNDQAAHSRCETPEHQRPDATNVDNNSGGDGLWTWMTKAIARVLPPPVTQRQIRVVIRDVRATILSGDYAFMVKVERVDSTMDSTDATGIRHCLVAGVSFSLVSRSSATTSEVVPPFDLFASWRAAHAGVPNDHKRHSHVDGDGVEGVDTSSSSLEINIPSALSIDLTPSVRDQATMLTSSLLAEWSVPAALLPLQALRFQKRRWLFATQAVLALVRDRRIRWTFTAAHLRNHRFQREALIRQLSAAIMEARPTVDIQSVSDILELEDVVGYRDVVEALRLVARQKCLPDDNHSARRAWALDRSAGSSRRAASISIGSVEIKLHDRFALQASGVAFNFATVIGNGRFEQHDVVTVASATIASDGFGAFVIQPMAEAGEHSAALHVEAIASRKLRRSTNTSGSNKRSLQKRVDVHFVPVSVAFESAGQIQLLTNALYHAAADLQLIAAAFSPASHPGCLPLRPPPPATPVQLHCALIHFTVGDVLVLVSRCHTTLHRSGSFDLRASSLSIVTNDWPFIVAEDKVHIAMDSPTEFEEETIVKLQISATRLSALNGGILARLQECEVEQTATALSVWFDAVINTVDVVKISAEYLSMLEAIYALRRAMAAPGARGPKSVMSYGFYIETEAPEGSAAPPHSAVVKAFSDGRQLAIRSLQTEDVSFFIHVGVIETTLNLGFCGNEVFDTGDLFLEILPMLDGTHTAAPPCASALLRVIGGRIPTSFTRYHAERVQVGIFSETLPTDRADVLDEAYQVIAHHDIAAFDINGFHFVNHRDSRHRRVTVTASGSSKLLIGCPTEHVRGPEFRASRIRNAIDFLCPVTCVNTRREPQVPARRMVREVRASIRHTRFDFATTDLARLDIVGNGVVVLEQCEFVLPPHHDVDCLVRVADSTTVFLKDCVVEGAPEFVSVDALLAAVKVQGTGTIVDNGLIVRKTTSAFDPAAQNAASLHLTIRTSKMSAEIAMGQGCLLQIRTSSTNISWRKDPATLELDVTGGPLFVDGARAPHSHAHSRNTNPDFAVSSNAVPASDIPGSLRDEAPPSELWTPADASMRQFPDPPSITNSLSGEVPTAALDLAQQQRKRRRARFVDTIPTPDVTATPAAELAPSTKRNFAETPPTMSKLSSRASSACGDGETYASAAFDSLSVLADATFKIGLRALYVFEKEKLRRRLDECDFAAKIHLVSIVISASLTTGVIRCLAGWRELLHSTHRYAPPKQPANPAVAATLRGVIPTEATTRLSPWAWVLGEKHAPTRMSAKVDWGDRAEVHLRLASPIPLACVLLHNGAFDLTLVDHKDNRYTLVKASAGVTLFVFNHRLLHETRVMAKSNIDLAIDHRWARDALAEATCRRPDFDMPPGTMVPRTVDTRSFWGRLFGARSQPLGVPAPKTIAANPAQHAGTHVKCSVSHLSFDADRDVVTTIAMAVHDVVKPAEQTCADHGPIHGLILEDYTGLGFTIRPGRSGPVSRPLKGGETKSARGFVCGAFQMRHEPVGCLTGSSMRIMLISGPAKRNAKPLVFTVNGRTCSAESVPVEAARPDAVGWSPPADEAANVYYTSALHFGSGVTVVGRLIVGATQQRFTLLSPFLILNQLPFPLTFDLLEEAYGDDPFENTFSSLHDDEDKVTEVYIGRHYAGSLPFAAMDDEPLRLNALPEAAHGNNTRWLARLPTTARCLAQLAALQSPATSIRRFTATFTEPNSTQIYYAFADLTFNSVIGVPQLTVRPTLVVVNHTPATLRLQLKQSIVPLLDPNWAAPQGPPTFTHDTGRRPATSRQAADSPLPESSTEVVIDETTVTPGVPYSLLCHNPEHSLSLRVARCGNTHGGKYDVPISLLQPAHEFGGMLSVASEELYRARAADVLPLRGVEAMHIRLGFTIVSSRLLTVETSAVVVRNASGVALSVDTMDGSVIVGSVAARSRDLEVMAPSARTHLKLRCEGASNTSSAVFELAEAVATGPDIVCPTEQVRASGERQCCRVRVQCAGVGVYEIVPSIEFASERFDAGGVREAVVIQHACVPSGPHVLNELRCISACHPYTVYYLPKRGPPTNYFRFGSGSSWTEWVCLETLLPTTGSASWAAHGTDLMVRLTRDRIDQPTRIALQRYTEPVVTIVNLLQSAVSIDTQGRDATQEAASTPIEPRTVCAPYTSCSFAPELTVTGMIPTNFAIATERHFVVRLDAARPAVAASKLQPVSPNVCLVVTPFASSDHGLRYLVVLVPNPRTRHLSLRTALTASKASLIQHVECDAKVGPLSAVINGVLEVNMRGIRAAVRHASRGSNDVHVRFEAFTLRDLTAVAEQREIILRPITIEGTAFDCDATCSHGVVKLAARRACVAVADNVDAQLAEDIAAVLLSLLLPHFVRLDGNARDGHTDGGGHSLSRSSCSIMHNDCASAEVTVRPPRAVLMALGEAEIFPMRVSAEFCRSRASDTPRMRSLAFFSKLRHFRTGVLDLARYSRARIRAPLSVVVGDILHHYASSIPSQVFTILASNKHIMQSSYLLGEVLLNSSPAGSAALMALGTMFGAVAGSRGADDANHRPATNALHHSTALVVAPVQTARTARPAATPPPPHSPVGDDASAVTHRGKRSLAEGPPLAPPGPPDAWIAEDLATLASRLDCVSTDDGACNALKYMIEHYGAAGPMLLISLRDVLTHAPPSLYMRHWGAIEAATELRTRFGDIASRHGIPLDSAEDDQQIMQRLRDSNSSFTEATARYRAEAAPSRVPLALAPPFFVHPATEAAVVDSVRQALGSPGPSGVGSSPGSPLLLSRTQSRIRNYAD